MMALMKAMTKNAPVIKNVFERLLIVLGVVASKILNYFFFFECIPHLMLNFSYCVPNNFCNNSEDCKGDSEVCIYGQRPYVGKCMELNNRRDKINCDL